jgi:hypothetical protein
MQLYSIPMMQVREKSVVIYDQPLQQYSRRYNPLLAERMKKARKTRYSGMMSAGARKRLTRAVTLLVQSSKKKWMFNPVTDRYQFHQISFLTLTVSDPTKLLTGKEAFKQLLSHFLQWLRRTEKVTTYIWKAEHQRNGQIHYHITTPSFLHYQRIRDKWNNLQRKAGLLDKYHEVKGHYDANSTDIHSVRNVRDLASYLIKYIAKSYQNESSINGKVWDCSSNLSGKKYFEVELSDYHVVKLENDVATGKANKYSGDRFTIVKWKENITDKLLTETEYKLFIEYLTVIRGEDG